VTEPRNFYASKFHDELSCLLQLIVAE
jgi:hypothetical protein